MLPTWVISDTHLGHTNIREYCPWRQTWSESIGEHDCRLVNAWAASVGSDETVLHLGDFAFGSREQIAAYRARVPGRIILTVGNHDRKSMTALRALGLEPVKQYEFQLPDGRLVLARHDPTKFTPEDIARADVLLHGHWHGDGHRNHPDMLVALGSKLIDCGVDAQRSLAPLRILDLLAQGLPAAAQRP